MIDIVERLQFYIMPSGNIKQEAAAEILRLRADLAAANTRMSKLDFERTAAELERDALRARLAPVDDEELVEIAVKEVEKVIASANDSDTVGGARWKALRVAIAAIRPHIEAAEREWCAKIADKHEHVWHSELAHPCARAIAAAIRSGK